MPSEVSLHSAATGAAKTEATLIARRDYAHALLVVGQEPANLPERDQCVLMLREGRSWRVTKPPKG